jgi:hypothetical protein
MKKKYFREDVEYDPDYPERMDPSIEDALNKGKTPFSKHPAMPKGQRRFDQIAASKRFKDVVDKFQRYVGTREPLRGGNAMQRLTMSAMNLVSQINQIEQRNKEYLENLAVDLVEKTMKTKGRIKYVAELVSLRGGMQSDPEMQGQPEKYSDEEIENAFQQNAENASPEDLLNFEDAFEKFDLEKAKRRFINSLIQGASKKGHYMFELVVQELENINPNLVNLYGMSQSTLDMLYWLYPEEYVKSMAASGQGQAGQAKADIQTKPPTVYAKGATFPILVHELIKGTMQLPGAHGLPDDPTQSEMVVGSEDTLVGEVWDLRLGPIFWEKFLESYPDEVFEDDLAHIQNYLFARFSMVTASEFMELAKAILSGHPSGKKFMQDLVNQTIQDLKRQEYEQAMGDEDDDEGGFATTNDDDDDGGDDDGGDIDWGSLLGGTGVSKK